MQWPTWIWEKWFLLIADIYWENTCPLLIVYNCNSTNINAVLSCPTITFFLLYSYTGVAINDPHWLILYLISKSNGSKDNWYLLMMNYKVSCLKCQDFSNQHTKQETYLWLIFESDFWRNPRQNKSDFLYLHSSIFSSLMCNHPPLLMCL